MYLLKYWFRKKFPQKDYEKALVDPDPIIQKRKELLKAFNNTLREKMEEEILLNLMNVGSEEAIEGLPEIKN